MVLLDWLVVVGMPARGPIRVEHRERIAHSPQFIKRPNPFEDGETLLERRSGARNVALLASQRRLTHEGPGEMVPRVAAAERVDRVDKVLRRSGCISGDQAISKQPVRDGFEVPIAHSPAGPQHFLRKLRRARA